MANRNASQGIKNSFKVLYSKKFQSVLKNSKNPYCDGCASQKIVKVLKTVPLDNILKKFFFNVKFSL